MLTIRRTALVAAFAGLLALPSVASAQTQVTDRTTISNPYNLDWLTLGPELMMVNNPFLLSLGFTDVTVSQDQGFFWRRDAGTTWGRGFTEGEHLLWAPYASTITFDFSNSVTAFATQMWLNYACPPSTFTLNAYLAGNLVGTVNMSGQGAWGGLEGQAPLVGFEHLGGFDKVELISSATSPEFAINAVTLGQLDKDALLRQATATPEPASMALLGTGLLGIGARMRRRRQNVAA